MAELPSIPEDTTLYNPDLRIGDGKPFEDEQTVQKVVSSVSEPRTAANKKSTYKKPLRPVSQKSITQILYDYQVSDKIIVVFQPPRSEAEKLATANVNVWDEDFVPKFGNFAASVSGATEVVGIPAQSLTPNDFVNPNAIRHASDLIAAGLSEKLPERHHQPAELHFQTK